MRRGEALLARRALFACVLAVFITLLPACGYAGGGAVSSEPIPLRISCVGDSITYGFGLEHREETCWVSLLPALLPEGTTTENFGVSGTCALEESGYPWTQTVWAHEFWDTEEDVVILMLGTNDVCDRRWDVKRFEADYGELVEQIKAKPANPRVIVMLPPVLYADPQLDARLAEEAIPAIERVAQRSGAQVVDLHTLTEDHPEWFDDGVHPNADAQEAIASCIAEVLLEG